MKDNRCPVCGAPGLQERHGDFRAEVPIHRKGTSQLVVPGIHWYHCPSCGEDLLDESAEEVINESRRFGMGLLSTREIRALRFRLRLTQEEMSALLGVGEKTYCRWESGDYLQSEASDRYLRLLIEEPSNVSTLHQIIAAKEQATDMSVTPQKRPVFSYLSDVSDVERREKRFVFAMECGTLQVPGKGAR